MVKNCGSCGAPCAERSIGASWKCGFCETVNYNEGYVEAYLSNIDVAKLTNYMRLAKASYEARNFEDAAEKFDMALAENSENAEAWAYKALSLVHTINLSNIDSVPSQVEACFQQANSLEAGGGEFLEAAHAIARERIVAELLRSANREVEQAQKSAFAFSHDAAAASSRASKRYNNAFVALAACLETPSENVRQMLDVCKLTMLASQQQYAPEASAVVQSAHSYVDQVRARFPSMEIDMPQPKKMAACFPAHARVATGRGRWTTMGDLRIGDTVLAYDSKAGDWHSVPVVRIRQRIAVQIVELHLANGQVIDTTASHSFLTQRGWVAAGDLGVEDTCLMAEPGRGAPGRGGGGGGGAPPVAGPLAGAKHDSAGDGLQHHHIPPAYRVRRRCRRPRVHTLPSAAFTRLLVAD